MKKALLFAILLCLGLGACGTPAGAELPTVLPTLPTPTHETPWPISGGPTREDGELPVLLETGEGETSMLRGPAGTVAPCFFLGDFVTDWTYGDVDGDGETELIYLCPGPTSGLFTEGVCVYGLEQGWPVLKACTIFNLNWGEPRLEQDGNEVLFCLDPASWHPGPSGTGLQALRLPVTAEDGQVLLNGGELPEGVQGWGSLWVNYYGTSFRKLSEALGEKAFFQHWSCLVWQEEALLPSPSDSSDDAEEYKLRSTYAAVTDNGVTVTGLICWEESKDGSIFCVRDGIEPIRSPEDPEALLGLSAEALEEGLGPCHFDLGSGFYPCWFTEDGKLLTVRLFDSVVGVELRDLLEGEAPFASAADADTVTVDQRERPAAVENAARWERFLEAAKEGEADAVVLRLIYGEDTYELPLSYDGGVYTLEDEGRISVFRYLIASVEEPEPQAPAQARSAVRYLLSDDPDMTYQRYFSYMVSSAYHPDFPNTRSLFVLYKE